MDISSYQQIEIHFSDLTGAEFLRYMIEADGVGAIEINGNCLTIWPTPEILYRFYGKKINANNFDEWNW